MLTSGSRVMVEKNTLRRLLAKNQQLFPKTLLLSKRQDPAEPEIKSETRKENGKKGENKGRKESFRRRLIALSTRSQE